MRAPPTLPPMAPASARSAEGRADFRAGEARPLFRADWLRTVFIHFAVPAADLQPCIPYPLDLYDGLAYVSLVAFTLERMRLGPLPHSICRHLLRPLSPCRYLNARTYVRAAGTEGIFFLAEWLSNHAAVPLGAPLFGLPYRAGRLAYGMIADRADVRGRVTSDAGGSLLYTGQVAAGAEYAPASQGGRDEFLLERYTAFTEHHGAQRLFRVWHPPWPQAPLELELHCASLLPETGDWCRAAQFIGAHFSPGVRDVWMGRPHRLRV